MMYSSAQSVQGLVDEKELLMMKYPMKTEGLISARGSRRYQSQIQTPRGETRLKEGVIQRGILTEDTTFGKPQLGSRGLAPSMSDNKQPQTPD